MRYYQKANRLGKIFMWISLGLLVAYFVLYAQNVSEALAMDPTSYNCISDSMMKQVCTGPYGSAIYWSGLLLVLLGWPVVVAWVVVGLIILFRRKRKVTAKV